MIPRGRKRQKWIAFGDVVKYGRDWSTAANNIGMSHRGIQKGRKNSITPGKARNSASATCGTSARLVSLHSSHVCDFVCFVFL